MHVVVDEEAYASSWAAEDHRCIRAEVAWARTEPHAMPGARCGARVLPRAALADEAAVKACGEAV
eukprot:395780-Lingulodinium_polyedra.AAC.1